MSDFGWIVLLCAFALAYNAHSKIDALNDRIQKIEAAK